MDVIKTDHGPKDATKMSAQIPPRIATAIVMALILLFVLGCGQKGDLYLPDNTAASFAKGFGVVP